MKVIPKGNFVLIELRPKEPGLNFNDSPNFPVEANVVAVTEDVEDFPPRFKVGDRVLVPSHKGFGFRGKGDQSKKLIPQSDLISKIEDDK